MKSPDLDRLDRASLDIAADRSAKLREDFPKDCREDCRDFKALKQWAKQPQSQPEKFSLQRKETLARSRRHGCGAGYRSASRGVDKRILEQKDVNKRRLGLESAQTPLMTTRDKVK